jgi:hypothetical protein
MDSHSKVALLRYNGILDESLSRTIMEIWLQPIGREGQTQYNWLVKLGIKLIFKSTWLIRNA